MNKERSRQIYIDQFDVKLLRKEFIVKIECFSYVSQHVVKDEIIVAGCQHHIIK